MSSLSLELHRKGIEGGQLHGVLVLDSPLKNGNMGGLKTNLGWPENRLGCNVTQRDGFGKAGGGAQDGKQILVSTFCSGWRSDSPTVNNDVLEWLSYCRNGVQRSRRNDLIGFSSDLADATVTVLWVRTNSSASTAAEERFETFSSFKYTTMRSGRHFLKCSIKTSSLKDS